MPGVYKSKVLQTRVFTDVNERTVQIHRDDEETMGLEEIQEIVQGLQDAAEKKGQKIRILVRGLSPIGMFTLKGYNDEFNVEQLEDYYQNRVQLVSKFATFSQLQITIEKEL